MLKNILVPVDPGATENAAKSIEIAEHLLSKDGKITLLSVIEEVPEYVLSELPNDFMDKAAEATDKILQKLAERASSKVEIVLKTGHAARAINQFANSHGSDLIIIASHKPELLDHLLGSTAISVVKRAKCAVYVTR